MAVKVVTPFYVNIPEGGSGYKRGLSRTYTKWEYVYITKWDLVLICFMFLCDFITQN